MARIQATDLQWNAIDRRPAPFNADLQLAVLDIQGVHALVFPCRRILGGWLNTSTQKRVNLRPTHWRRWTR